MTYAYITEWMEKDDVERFDRDLLEHPRVAARRNALGDAQQLMAVFGMPVAE